MYYDGMKSNRWGFTLTKAELLVFFVFMLLIVTCVYFIYYAPAYVPLCIPLVGVAFWLASVNAKLAKRRVK